ncbi:[protein-PII] uridylyltransferase [Nocardioides thalensis]|uniref:Bifunctional uridylyltransferase/uridylyl-removing enzyme n=1 Tax=Nocardioides thalensis TaxID=1914755 RepID=A0A853C364_9ACTN|nr:[protein-PII] uridylyltransferase [Nocardioides thalensis]NYJ00763.1 [protein-PII] uridylyltransferase [Nocardioides thalensis]
MTAADRAARTEDADALCAGAYEAAGGPGTGAALVAVGGYGRGELAPYSDLDVVLVADDAQVDVDGEDWAELAGQVWYPIWDSGAKLDHSVRSLPQMLEAADADVRVASGLLDVRHVAGDPNLTLRLRTAVLASWRRRARERLPELRELVRSRHRLVGELAHLSVPDLKEAEGGLRDATVLRSLTTSWLVDVSAADLERGRLQLLDLRDVLHGAAGRATDRIGPEHWATIAEALELDDERAAQRQVRELGRRLTHLSRLAWRRTDDALRRTPAAKPRRPELEHLAPGVALSQGEVVLERNARPASDPTLLLRAAAEAAVRDVVLAPPTAARLARESPPLPVPWPDEARRQLVRLLTAGPGLLAVWETLEETGALTAILPEWDRIRLLPHASVIHRFTVDRHSVETCMEAAALIREVSRPDVLAVAALLHDIGKGSLTEHSVAGAPIARTVAERMGFDDDAVALVELLVRRHLLLAEVATTRDPDDPATLDALTAHVTTPEALALLTALTEADARATSPKAWSTWRAGLIHDLSRRAAASLKGESPPPAAQLGDLDLPETVREGGVSIQVDAVRDGSRITVVATDRVGLLADVAAMLALRRIGVRAARVWSQGEYGVSVWDVVEEHLDPGLLRDQLDNVLARRVDPSARLAPRAATGAELAPTVVVRPEASDQATVVEVRAADRLGVLYLVCSTLAGLDISVRSAHVSTLGPQAVDVFYVQEASAGALSETRAAEAAHAVRQAVSRLTT